MMIAIKTAYSAFLQAEHKIEFKLQCCDSYCEPKFYDSTGSTRLLKIFGRGDSVLDFSGFGPTRALNLGFESARALLKIESRASGGPFKL